MSKYRIVKTGGLYYPQRQVDVHGINIFGIILRKSGVKWEDLTYYEHPDDLSGGGDTQCVCSTKKGAKRCIKKHKNEQEYKTIEL